MSKSIIAEEAQKQGLPELELIRKALEEARSIEDAADKLNVLPNSLRYKMRQLGVKAVKQRGYRLIEA